MAPFFLVDNITAGVLVSQRFGFVLPSKVNHRRIIKI